MRVSSVNGVGGVSGCSKLKARDQLNKGVADFKNGQYDAAIEHFKQAKEADLEASDGHLLFHVERNDRPSKNTSTSGATGALFIGMEKLTVFPSAIPLLFCARTR